MAAAIATLDKLRRRRMPSATWRAWASGCAPGSTAQARRHGVGVRQTGPAQMPMILFDDDPDFEKGNLFAATALRAWRLPAPVAQHVPVAAARRGRYRPGAGGHRPGARGRRRAIRLSATADDWLLDACASAQKQKGRSYDMAVTTAAEVGHGHNATPAFLADRARFVRLETVRLTRIAGAGHYSSTFSAAELFAALYYAHLRIDPARPEMAGPRPLRAEQGPRRHRPLSGARRPRLLRALRCSTATRGWAARSATTRT